MEVVGLQSSAGAHLPPSYMLVEPNKTQLQKQRTRLGAIHSREYPLEVESVHPRMESNDNGQT